MDDIESLRQQYSSLRRQLDQQQGILNAYLKGKLPTGRALAENGASPHGLNRGKRSLLQQPSAGRAFKQNPDCETRLKTPTSKQRLDQHSRTKLDAPRTSEKRKSSSGTPRQVGRGSSLAHHGSESKRLRSMENRHPQSHTDRFHAGPHHHHSSRKHSKEGRGKQRVAFGPSLSIVNPQRRHKDLVDPEPFTDEVEQETDENVAEGSYVEQLLSPGNSRLAATRAREISPKPRSILLTPGGRTKKTPARVSFLQRLNRGHQNSPIRAPSPAHHSTRSALSTSALQGSIHDRSVGSVTQPLLGYDWIAGVLDTADTATDEQSNAYLEEIKLFRQLNRDECVHTTQAEKPDGMDNTQTFLHAEDPHTKAQEHKCIHNYALNNRLFAVPLHGDDDGESLCAICQTKRSSKPKSTLSPSYIRVSIPRSTLSSPYRVRPHRRQSFDPTDSMGLSQHCLAGWQNSRPSMMPPAASVDLRASLDKTMVAASTLFDSASCDGQDMTAGRPLGPSRHTQDLLNRSHALRVDLQRLERAGLSMQTSQMDASRNYPLL